MSSDATAAVPGAPLAEHQKPILDHIPETLKRLALFLAKSFFGREHFVVMDYIVKLECVREEDLRSLLKFDQKYLRQLVLQLRQDKLLKERTGQEEQPDGKAKKVNYYFTNYRAIVNVAKYKVDHMRQKLEAREKTKTHRSSYKCTGCFFQYDALDMDKIYDPMTAGLVCYRCNGSVEHDETVGPNDDTRSSLAKFNEQLTVMFSMIQQLDGIRLAPHLLEPAVNNSIALAQQQQAAEKAAARLQVGERAFRATEANRSEMFRTDMGITVTIDDGEAVAKTEEKKAVPWLEASAHAPGISVADTAKAAADAEAAGMGVKEAAEEAELPLSPPIKKKRAADEILGMLQEEMAHEASEEPGEASSSSAGEVQPSTVSLLLSEETAAVSPSSASEAASQAPANEDEMMSDDGDDYVHVQGTRYHVDDVTTDMVEKMTPAEREAYTRLSMTYNDY